MVLRVGLAARQVLLHEHVDGDAVLSMHHDHRAVLCRRLHRTQNLAVVAVEHARVCHEQLEAGDTLVVNQVGHVFQRLFVDAADDLVKCIVNCTVSTGFAVPFSQTELHIFVVTLQRHVDDRRNATPRSGNRAGLKGVYRRGAAEGQFHVRVHIDAARHDVFPFGVDHLVGSHAHRIGLTARIQSDDRFAVDQHVLVVTARWAHYRAVLDECAGHDCLLISIRVVLTTSLLFD